ncbi:Isoprenyl transferase [Chlamydiales bacterium STE3]|nr:Isoprenyl transferase [Chlamydiales bacterium STE3]
MTISLDLEEEKALHYYTPEELSSLYKYKLPSHIAFILDGNRRWAKKTSCGVTEGHRRGADTLMEIIKAAKELGIKVLTLYVFSTENWQRPQNEIQALMWLFESYIRSQTAEMVNTGMLFDTIGDLSKLPLGVNNAIQEAKKATQDCSDIKVVFAMNYGARDEMRRAIQQMFKDYSSQGLPLEEITEERISAYLDTKAYPDPDLVIRTGGEKRISNFLLWQSSYAELYITDVFWPDFTPQHLLKAISSYQLRERRLGQ